MSINLTHIYVAHAAPAATSALVRIEIPNKADDDSGADDEPKPFLMAANVV